MNRIKQIVSLTLLVLVLGIVGQMDFDDYIETEKRKCEYQNGTWIIEQNGNNQYCK